MEKTIDLNEIFPYHACENNLILTGYGYITAGFDIMLPEVFTTEREKHVSNIDSISNTIKNLPVGTIVHKQDFFYNGNFDPELSEDIDICKAKNFKSYAFKALSNSYSRLYISFPVADVDKKIKSALFNIKDYITSSPSKAYINKYNEVVQTIDGFEGMLRSIGWEPKRMNDNSLASALYDYWNISYSKPCELKQGENMHINPYHLEDGNLKIGNENIAVLSLVKQPSTLISSVIPTLSSGEVYENDNDFINNINIESSFTYPIGLGLPIDHIVNTVIEVDANSVFEAELAKEKRDLNFGAGLGMFGGSKASDKQALIDLFIQGVEQGGYQLCKTAISIIINEPDKKKLNTYIELTKQALSNMGDSIAFVENKKSLMQFMAFAPGNTKTVERDFYSTTELSVAYWIRESNYYSDKEGTMFLDRFGNPISVNMWENKYIEARNKVVFGPTGTGKSVLMNHYLSEALGMGNHIVGIDVGGSYERSVELNNGLYFDAADKEKLKFNPFLLEKDREGNYLLGLDSIDYKTSGKDPEEGYNVAYDINFLFTVVSATWKGGDDTRQKMETVAIIKEQIKEYYRYVNQKKLHPSFDGFYNFVLKIFKENQGKKYSNDFFNYGSFELICIEFTKGGRYPLLLNAESNFDFIDDKYIVFDLEAIENDEAIKGLVAGLIINLVTLKIEKVKGKRVTFFIDEAIDFLKGDMGEFIGGMYRKIRKKNGEVIIATQSVLFLESAVPLVMQSITQNTSTIMLLDHSKVKGSTYELLEKHFSFSKDELTQLDSLQIHHGKENPYGEMLLKMGDLTRVLRLQLSEFSLAVYDTRKKEVTAINEIRDRLDCNVANAINIHIANKASKRKK